MKVKCSLKLLCKYCSFEKKKGKLYVKCEKHGKHKQRQMFSTLNSKVNNESIMFNNTIYSYVNNFSYNNTCNDNMCSCPSSYNNSNNNIEIPINYSSFFKNVKVDKINKLI